MIYCRVTHSPGICNDHYFQMYVCPLTKQSCAITLHGAWWVTKFARLINIFVMFSSRISFQSLAYILNKQLSNILTKRNHFFCRMVPAFCSTVVDLAITIVPSIPTSRTWPERWWPTDTNLKRPPGSTRRDMKRSSKHSTVQMMGLKMRSMKVGKICFQELGDKIPLRHNPPFSTFSLQFTFRLSKIEITWAKLIKLNLKICNLKKQNPTHYNNSRKDQINSVSIFWSTYIWAFFACV